MKRPLKPNERIALFAALIAVGGGLTPLLVRGSQSPEGFGRRRAPLSFFAHIANLAL